jgi:hypothetical protein
VPLDELLKREEESEKVARRQPDATKGKAMQPVERKSKGLSMKTPSFFLKKKTATRKQENVEEKEDN